MARIFITGSTQGLSLAAARSLIVDGHDVVLHSRSMSRAGNIADVVDASAGIAIGDLSRADDVRGVAEQVDAIGRMDAVIHNAGVYRVPERGKTPEGHATLVAVNTLAPYMLTALMRRPDRLIYLSSSLHRGGAGPLDDLHWCRRDWDSAKAYAESKLHVATLALAVSRCWPEMLSNAVDPGWVRTRIGGRSAPVDLETGQRPQSWLAVSDDPRALTSGGYGHAMSRDETADEVRSEGFQNRMIGRLSELTGVALTRHEKHQPPTTMQN